MTLIKAGDKQDRSPLARTLEAAREDLSGVRVPALAHLDRSDVVGSEHVSDSARVKRSAAQDAERVEEGRNDGRFSDQQGEHGMQRAQLMR